MNDTKPDSRELEARIDIAASSAQVWTFVSDLPRLAEFGDQLLRSFVPGGVRLGANMINLNRQGWKVWPTTSKVVRFDPEREIAFRVRENRIIWSFRLVPTPEGTTLVHRRETPDGISTLSTALINLVLGGTRQFDVDRQAGMEQTLERIKELAEA